MTLARVLLSAPLLALATNAAADTWTPLTPTTCPSSSTGLFTTGQQYIDSANGVLQDSWSMLVRWQDPQKTIGPTHWIADSVAYDLGAYTTYAPPGVAATWQRGYQPESGLNATPGVQLNCFDAGMVINTWYTPHGGDPFGATATERSGVVDGGQFNDMYGYAWSAPNRPYAFRQRVRGNWAASDLVLQGLLAVPAVQTFDGSLVGGAWSFAPVADINDLDTFSGSAQLDFFAYIEDTTHPGLNPIALIAQVYGNGPASFFSCPAAGVGLVRKDYAEGVWYGATPLCSTDISTVEYTAGLTTNTLSPELTFYRIHYTPQNLQNLIARINGPQCGSSCYSSDPNAYVVQYAGVIAEIAPCAHRGSVAAGNLAVLCTTNLRDATEPGYIANKDGQIGMAVRMRGISVYARSAD
jgi:hypothetical protein